MRKPLVVVIILLLIASIAGNIFQYLQRPVTYPFLDTAVTDVTQDNRLINFIPLRYDLVDYLATQSANIGMYFEYIPTGVSIGINEKRPYLYASLLKLPLIMAIYNKINVGGLSFADTQTITKSMLDDHYGDLWKKGEGTTITVRDAVEKALVESDDTAYNVLKSDIAPSEFLRVFDYLDIPIDEEASEAAVTPKNYTSVLRSLVFSSYLSPKDSNNILKMLTRASFADGIRAPIPAQVPVAHKFGIRRDLSYLSDCGVIYVPTRPYFLCVMSKAGSVEESEQIMQQISAKVYAYISTLK